MTSLGVDSRRDTVLALEAQLWFLGRRSGQRAAAAAVELAPRLGLVGYAVLSLLATEGSMRQGDVAEQVGIDKSAMSRLTAELVELGLVVRTEDPTDRRAHLLDLSEAGRERMGEIRAARRAHFADRLQGWSDEDLRRLTALLRRYNVDLND